MFAGFLFMLFLVLLFIIAIGGSIIRGILNLLFGRTFRQSYGTTHGGSRTHADQSRQADHRSSRQSQSQHSAPSNGKKREKIFDKTDGEYVDFEEIKE